MSRRFGNVGLLATLVILGACGGGHNTSAPSRLDNACSILSQKPQFKRAFQAAERRWGVPVHVQMATIYQESKFVADARTPYRWTLGVIPMGRISSAYGYSQALDGTWDEYRADTRQRNASRTDIRDSADFIGWYMSQSTERLDIPLADTRNQYLAYHEGRTGFARQSYKSKPWLMRVSGEVAARAQTYQQQLQSCT
ncbi:MAG: lytic transglycosylase [Pseudomonadota bacterium]